jgi:hypothetical protein
MFRSDARKGENDIPAKSTIKFSDIIPPIDSAII